jgi:multiple antibiotic resistance protein
MLAILNGLVLLVGTLDWLTFSNLDRLAEQLDPSRMAVTEAVFGVLLAALAVQLMLNGLVELGVISMVPH